MLYIFDMGGVVTSTAVVIPKICELLGLSKEKFFEYCGCSDLTGEFHPREMNLISMVSYGFIDSPKFWELFSLHSGISVNTDWWRWLFHPVLNNKTVSIVKKLKEQGNRVVCGTNTMSCHYSTHLERGDYAYFDQTYSSCAMGVSKPDPQFWKLILSAEETEPEASVFIDDRKENCEAASSLGIKAIQFTTAEELAEKLNISL